MSQTAFEELASSGMGQSEYRVFLQIATCLSRDGWTHVDQTSLAEKLGMGRANFSRSLNRLAREGFIAKGPKKGRSPTLGLGPKFTEKASPGRAAGEEGAGSSESDTGLTLMEQRIVLACLPVLKDVEDPIRDSGLSPSVVCFVRVRNLARACGVDGNGFYRAIRTATDRLYERKIYLRTGVDGRPVSKSSPARWIDSKEYLTGEGIVRVCFSSGAIPALVRMARDMTRLPLAPVLRMSSTYALRLYRLLCRWCGEGQKMVPLDALRRCLSGTGGSPERYSEFSRTVIVPAVEQINEHSPLWVKWKAQKTGRKVSHIVFTFGEKPSQGVVQEPILATSERDVLPDLVETRQPEPLKEPPRKKKTRKPRESVPTSLYRHYDAVGCLLYVGISLSAFTRFAQHKHGSLWSANVTRMEIEHYASREAALAAEKEIIETERPVWNVQHSAPIHE